MMPLDPTIIEIIRRREEEERRRKEQERPPLQLPVPEPVRVPRPPKDEDAEGERGVVIIDIGGDDEGGS